MGPIAEGDQTALTPPLPAKKAVEKEIGMPWERQPGETAKAYESFRLYRNMGPSRSYAKVGRMQGKNISQIEEWGRKYHWVERSALYDQDLDRELFFQQEAERRQMLKNHGQISNILMGKMLQRVQKLKPEEIHSRDVVHWFAELVKIERMSKGLPTDRIETSGTMISAQTEVTDDPGQLAELLNIFSRMGTIPPCPDTKGTQEGDHPEADEVHPDSADE